MPIENDLPGGLADKLSPKHFDKKQLAIGARHELEHTGNRRLAREIAMDHLAEDPDYYKKLAMIEGEEDESEERFGFDPNSTENQGRWRLKDPDLFDRMWTEYDKKDDGISYIKGTFKKDDAVHTQAIRFDKELWTESEGAEWWEENKGRFTKSWIPEDWEEWKRERGINNESILPRFIRLILEAKPFGEREHDWDEVLIDVEGRELTRGEIRDHYQRNAGKILPHLLDRDVIVLIGVRKNETVLKRKEDDRNIRITKERGIDDSGSFEYWVNRRVIEFHPVLGRDADMVWVDLDLHDGDELRERAEEIAPAIADMVREEFGGRVEVFDSGKTGLHVQGFLDAPVDVDQARDRLRARLDEMFATDEDLTTGIAKKGQIRLDTTTLKDTGSVRAPYSMSVTGGVKRPLSDVGLDEGDDEGDDEEVVGLSTGTYQSGRHGGTRVRMGGPSLTGTQY